MRVKCSHSYNSYSFFLADAVLLYFSVGTSFSIISLPVVVVTTQGTQGYAVTTQRYSARLQPVPAMDANVATSRHADDIHDYMTDNTLTYMST